MEEGRLADARCAHEGAQEVRAEASKEGSPVHQALSRRRLDWPDCKNARDLGGLPLDGGFTRPESQAAFGEVFTAIAAAGGPVLFHCFAGKDRTGLVAAMLLELAGVSREHIAADYGETDVQLAQQYGIWLSEAPPDRFDEMRADLSCSADRILGVLEHVTKRWGSVESYLDEAGVMSPNIDRLAGLLT